MADLLKGEMFMENYMKPFQGKDEQRASITWVLLLIVACIYYGIKVGTGTLTPGLLRSICRLRLGSLYCRTGTAIY